MKRAPISATDPSAPRTSWARLKSIMLEELTNQQQPVRSVDKRKSKGSPRSRRPDIQERVRFANE